MSGSTVHDGLDYQALVSALAAVELVILQGYASQLVIEPPSHEDLEAGVERVLEDSEPAPGESRSRTETTTESYTIAIQSKRRDNGIWTAPQVDGLLGHGKTRPPARDRLLADPKIRYLLVTSGTLVAEAMGLRVARFGEWPEAAGVDPRFDALNSDGRCRVGVMDALTEREILHRLDHALRTSLFMPFDRVERCIGALAAAADRRGGSAHSGVWTAAEISETLKSHEALLPGELDHGDYVEPRNYGEMRDTLRTEQAILILGPSGTGKTRTAIRLRDELRADLGGARSVTILPTDGPGRITAELQTLPAILYLEDPWGPVALVDQAAAWTKALNDAAAHRRRGGWLIITSRSDVYGAAGIPETDFARWKVTLDAEHYGEPERRRLLQMGLKALPYRIRALAEPHLDHAIGALTTPLEIKTYISGLAPGPASGESGPSLVARAMGAAKSKLYRDVIAAQVRDRKDEAAATVLWLLFNGKRTLTLQDLIQARRAMTQAHGQAPRLENLVDFLRAGHSLDQEQDRYSYAHPQVEAGLASAALRVPATFESAGKALIEALAARPSEAEVGPLLAARILANLTASRPVIAEDLAAVLSPGAQAEIGAHLLDALKTLDGAALAEVFQIAGRIGPPGVLHFDLARWLIRAAPIPPDADLEQMIPRWAATDPDPSWRQGIVNDPSAATLLEKVVEHLVDLDQEFYPDDFGARLAPLGVNLAPAFGRAALAMVRHGYNRAIARVIAGALPELAALEPAVRVAQALYAGDQPDDRHGWRLQLANGVFDAEHAEHLSAGDEGFWSAGEITEAWVRATRARNGWTSLAAFPGIGDLIWDWTRAIKQDPAALDPAEFEAMAAAAKGQRSEVAVWELASETPTPPLAAPIARRLGDSDLDEGVRRWLRRAQAVHDLPALTAEQDRLLAADDLEGVLALHRDLLPSLFRSPDAAWPAAQAALRAALPEALRVLAEAAVADLSDLRPDPAGPGGQAAARVRATDPAVASRLIRLTDGSHPDFDRLYGAAIDGWSPSDDEDAQAAFDAAIALGRTDLLRSALSHPRGSIAARAIDVLGDALSVADLIGLPGQEGSVVRAAIIAAVGRHAEDAAETALLHYCDDAYDDSYGGELVVNTLARQAAALLAARPIWSAALVEQVKARAPAYPDLEVARTLLMRLGSEAPDDRRWLLDLAADDTAAASLRFSAARSLLKNIALCAHDGLPAPPAELLTRAPAATAVALARVASVLLNEPDAINLANRLWSDADRRALALLLPRPDRKALTSHVAGLLPADHAAVALTENSTIRLKRSSLDGLAEPAVVRAILSLLSRRFEPAPKLIFGANP